ncbi:hypothetical protein GOP47_0031111 [Adiantum capillus-veneris]|nr:hypothetical protein GOP47_0031111 [Adiantum capillus-veneris]
MLSSIIDWFGSESALPASIYKLWRPEICVIIDEKDPRSREYERPWTDAWLENPPIRNKQIPRFGLTVIDQQGDFVQIEAQHGTYIAFTGDFLRLAFMSDCIEPIGLHYATPIASTALTFTLSRRQLLDKMLLQDHGFFVSRKALLMFTFNDTFTTGFLTFLATIPLMLQGRGYQTYSGIVSVLLYVLDFFRTPLYRMYDHVASELVRVIKLYVFGKNRALYDFFGTFSRRWKYCNNFKGHAYHETEFVTTRRVFVAKPNRIMRWSVAKETRYNLDPSDYDICIYQNSAHAMPMPNGTHNFIVYSTEQEVFVP